MYFLPLSVCLTDDYIIYKMVYDVNTFVVKNIKPAFESGFLIRQRITHT